MPLNPGIEVREKFYVGARGAHVRHNLGRIGPPELHLPANHVGVAGLVVKTRRRVAGVVVVRRVDKGEVQRHHAHRREIGGHNNNLDVGRRKGRGNVADPRGIAKGAGVGNVQQARLLWCRGRARILAHLAKRLPVLEPGETHRSGTRHRGRA